ncbi:MAG: NUDIX domain-containing protein [Methyloligellaceae bacterium]
MTENSKNQPQVEIKKQERLSDGFVKLDKITAEIISTQNERFTVTREVHDHGNSVTVLPVDRKRKTAILIGQWRLPAWVNNYRQRLWEAPAGMLEENEIPESCAIREALEETGYEVSNLKFICNTFASPGMMTERVSIFLADYSPETRKNTTLGLKDEGEDIELREFSFNELFTMLDKGEIHDAVTAIAIYALREELGKP